jgi:ABC-type polysaccharide/polyol phosphate export permease
MKDYLLRIWQCRYFWVSLVGMDLRTRYRRSVIGLGWSLLHPIAMTIILHTVFHRIFQIRAQEYAPFLLAGLACWNYLVQSTIQGCQCFIQGETYMRLYPAPSAIYPLRTAMGTTLHFLITLALVVGLTWWMRGLENAWALLALIPALVMLFAFCWSLATLAGICNVYFQDTQHLLEVCFPILFYLTPIIYHPRTLAEHDLMWLVNYNPLAALLDLVRTPILDGQLPELRTLALAAGTIVLMTVAAGLLLARQQRRLIFAL